MLDWFCEIWANQSVRYVSATALGFVLAILAQRTTTYLDHNRLRTSVREGLAQELADNLIVLDGYLETFRKNIHHQQRLWPLSTVQVSILERCLDPNVNVVLTPIEQVQFVIAYQQCNTLASYLAWSHQQVEANPARMSEVSRHVMDWYLPVVGQTLVDLLCVVLEEQRVFAYTHSAAMKHKLLPLYKADALSSDRTWRTSSIQDWQRSGPFLIAWKNDAACLVPDTVRVIELRLPEGSHRVIDLHSNTWYRRLFDPLTRRLQMWRLERDADQLAGEQENRHKPIRRMSDITDSDSNDE